MLDVIEHLRVARALRRRVPRRSGAATRTIRLVVSTGNVAFFVMRLMLLVGQFNYGKRGILDLTHTRLFTFGTFRRLFEQSGFQVLETARRAGAVSARARERPARPVAAGAEQALLIRVSRSLFAYQIFAVVQPRPGLAYLLDRAERESGRAVAQPRPRGRTAIRRSLDGRHGNQASLPRATSAPRPSAPRRASSRVPRRRKTLLLVAVLAGVRPGGVLDELRRCLRLRRQVRAIVDNPNIKTLWPLTTVDVGARRGARLGPAGREPHARGQLRAGARRRPRRADARRPGDAARTHGAVPPQRVGLSRDEPGAPPAGRPRAVRRRAPDTRSPSGLRARLGPAGDARSPSSSRSSGSCTRC